MAGNRTPFGKLPTHVAVAFVRCGDMTQRRRRHEVGPSAIRAADASPDAITATWRPGMKEPVEMEVGTPDAPILELRVSGAHFSKREIQKFAEMCERIAHQKGINLRVV